MSTEFLNFIISLIIIIAAAKLSGFVSTRLGQPAVLGELLAGLILGPTVLDILHTWPSLRLDEHLGESITLLAKLGVILLMLLAGLELNLTELLRAGRVSAAAGILGVLLPLAMGWGTARLFGVEHSQALFLGLALSATSVSISAQTLMELNVLRSRVGLALLGAAVFDDILVILLLSVAAVVYGQGTSGGLSSVLSTLGRMAAYLVIASIAGFRLVPWLTERVSRLPISQGMMAYVICLSLLFAWTAEALGGVAAITGAFLVGLFLGRDHHRHEIEEGIARLAYGFFVPIFFVNIGLAVNLRAIGSNAWGFALTLTAVAILSKIIGSGAGARLTGLSNLGALRLGIGMVSRGEVGLIVASFALIQGLLSPSNFSISVFMVIIATLITPIMLRAAYRNQPASETTAKVDSQPAETG